MVLPRVLFLIGLSCATPCYAQLLPCGEPLPVANERLKAEIKDKAQLLTPSLGQAEIAGQIEVDRTEIFARYPDADRARTNAYFQYEACVLIDRDTVMTTLQKIDVLQRVRHELVPDLPKIAKLLISPEGPFINSRDIGGMERTGHFSYYIDDKLVKSMVLTEAFGAKEMVLPVGRHAFRVEASVRGAWVKVKIDNSCASFFSLTDNAVMSPYVILKNKGDGGGYIGECSFLEKNDAVRRYEEDNSCGFFGTGVWPNC